MFNIIRTSHDGTSYSYSFCTSRSLETIVERLRSHNLSQVFLVSILFKTSLISVYNLANNLEVDETKAKIEVYRKDNFKIIQKNRVLQVGYFQ